MSTTQTEASPPQKNNQLTETHPFDPFIPNPSKHLILGSFVGKLFKGYNWYYSIKRNQFWPILENVYAIPLKTKHQKKTLFQSLQVATADIIYSCTRSQGNNSDTNLTNIVYNIDLVIDIFKNQKIENIYFTSKFVEKRYKKHFISLLPNSIQPKQIYLPSPSPRYATVSFEEKIKTYKSLLPKIGTG